MEEEGLGSILQPATRNDLISLLGAVMSCVFMYRQYLKHRVDSLFSHDALLQKLEVQISELPLFRTIGSIIFDTDELKLALTQECRLWKQAFGAALTRQASADMDAIFTFVDGMTKSLQRPITDLEDVRGAMSALREVSCCQ